MMCGMTGGMFWASFTAVLLLAGFAYIIWVMASKESGAVKIIGQIIAVIIAVLALIILLYGGIYGGGMGRGMRGNFGSEAKMMNPEMMRQMMSLPEKERSEFIKKMMEEQKK
jgi:hypothetical protein